MKKFNAPPKNGVLPFNGVLYFTLIILLKIILDISYKNIIVPLYRYAGFSQNRSASWMVLGWLVLLAFSILDYKMHENKHNRLSYVILHLLFLLSFVPFSVMVSAGYFNGKYVLANLIYWTLLYFYFFLLKDRGKRIVVKLGSFRLQEREINIILLFSLFVVLYISGRYTHFRFNFNFAQIYDLRAEASAYSIPTILKYAFSWTSAINTIMIAFYVRKKKYVMVIVCFIVQLLSFSIGGAKSVFFYALFALVINFFPSFSMKKYSRILLLGLLTITILSYFVYILFHSYNISSLFTRRVMFLPAQLGEKYFDFFSNNVPDYYRGSFLRFLGFTSPYSNISTLIGGQYFGTYEMGANNGLIADAMANLGFFGIIIQPVLYALTLRTLDRVSEGLDKRLYLAIALYISNQWINTFYFVSLITHGIIFIIIILSLMDKQKGELLA